MDLSAPRPARQPLGYAWLRLTDRLHLYSFLPFIAQCYYITFQNPLSRLYNYYLLIFYYSVIHFPFHINGAFGSGKFTFNISLVIFSSISPLLFIEILLVGF